MYPDLERSRFGGSLVNQKSRYGSASSAGAFNFGVKTSHKGYRFGANANNRVSVGRTATLFLSELWIFSSLCSSMMLAVEHESASILPFTPLTRTSTVAQLRGRGLSTLTLKVKSESDDSSCSSSWTYFAVDCDFDGESFGFFLPLHMRTKLLFYEHRLHVFPETG